MGKVQQISGEVIDKRKPKANAGVTEMLGYVAERNKQGRVSGVLIVEIRPSGRVRTSWSHLRCTGAPVLTIVAALEALKHDLLSSQRHVDPDE